MGLIQETRLGVSAPWRGLGSAPANLEQLVRRAQNGGRVDKGTALSERLCAKYLHPEQSVGRWYVPGDTLRRRRGILRGSENEGSMTAFARWAARGRAVEFTVHSSTSITFAWVWPGHYYGLALLSTSYCKREIECPSDARSDQDPLSASGILKFSSLTSLSSTTPSQSALRFIAVMVSLVSPQRPRSLTSPALAGCHCRGPYPRRRQALPQTWR